MPARHLTPVARSPQGALEVGATLGFQTVRQHRTSLLMLDEERLRPNGDYPQLMATRDDRRVGEFVYGLLSSVAHETTFGPATA